MSYLINSHKHLKYSNKFPIKLNEKMETNFPSVGESPKHMPLKMLKMLFKKMGIDTCFDIMWWGTMFVGVF